MRGIREEFDSDNEEVIFDTKQTNLLKVTTPLPVEATSVDVAYALMALASRYAHMAQNGTVSVPTPTMPIAIATHLFETVDGGPIILPIVLEVKRPDEGDVEILQALSGAHRRKQALDEAEK